MGNEQKNEGYMDLDNDERKEESGGESEEADPAAEDPEKEPKTSPPKSTGKKVKAPYKEVKTHLETDIDKLYELVRERGTAKVSEISKKLNINGDQIEEWGRILEDHKLIKLHYPPVGEPVLILKKFKTDTNGIKKLKKRKGLKPGRKVFVINLAILIGFIGFVVYYTIGIPFIRMPSIQIPSILQSIQIPYNQAYLAVFGIIIIIIIALVLIIRRRHGKEKKESG